MRKQSLAVALAGALAGALAAPVGTVGVPDAGDRRALSALGTSALAPRTIVFTRQPQ
jgi:hypothetical protein